MNISDASERSGLPAKTIRYYEEIGLLKPDRAGNGYRDYSTKDVHQLRFLQRSRGLGFSVEECRHLLDLYRDKDRASADVRTAAMTHIREIRAKIADLRKMERTLTSLVDACHGNQRPDCPIIDGLLHPEPADPPTNARDSH